MKVLGALLAFITLGLLIISTISMFADEAWVQLVQGRLMLMCIATGVSSISFTAIATMRWFMNPAGDLDAS